MTKDFFYVGGGAAKTLAEVAVLQRKYELFDTKIIKEIFNHVLKLEVTEITKPEIVGLPHVTYFVKTQDNHEYCFRANLGNESPEIELLIEKLVADLVKKAGVPSNTIIHVDCSRQKYQFDFQIQEKISGKTPEHNFQGTQQDYDKLSFELGQIIGKLSTVHIDGFGRFDKQIALTENRLVATCNSNFEYISLELESQIQTVIEAKLLNDSQGAKILQIFQDAKDLINNCPGSIVHYDLADHNFFYDPQTFKITGLFDWEAVCVSDPLLDLASAPTWKTLYERESQLLKGYQSVAILPENYQEMIHLYRLRTIIWKVVHNLKFNLLNPERLERFHKALKPFSILKKKLEF